ncbi:hypothetical protein HN415_00775 [Candidatus Woesearchaeota archaeon]|jgi:cytochrome c biogenesis protein CcdA|nr:hypothetical protein [Candidatus Woesearchaeota archaeon]
MKNIIVLFKGFKSGLKLYNEHIIIVVNSFLLTIVYIFGIGISYILLKLLNKRFINFKINKKRKTYWRKLEINKESIENYYRQF